MNCNKKKNKGNACILTTLVIDDDKSTTSRFFRHMRLLGGSGFALFLIIEGEKMFDHAQEGIVRCPFSGRYTWVTRVADADANGRIRAGIGPTSIGVRTGPT